MQVVYRGDVTELRGTRWDVPAGVPSSSMASWIESQHREQQAREAAATAKAEADAEAQARESELLAARVEAARTGEAFRTELNELRERIETVRGELETPDAESLMAMNASVMTAFRTAREVLEQVDEAIAKAETLTVSADAMLAEAEAQKQASISVLRTQQDAINGSFETYRVALADLQQQTNDASTAVGRLNAEAQDNRELIRTAGEITETAIDIAGLEAKKAVDEAMDETLALLSVAMEAMGITEESLALQMNADQIQPDRGVFLTREFLRRIKDIHSGKGSARDASIEGPLL